MTFLEESIKLENTAQDTQIDADGLSLEFLRDSRRYCRKLDCEVEE